jgi:hypothetical protein
MGLFDFFKDMGEKIFGSEDEAAEKIKENIEASNPGIQDLNVTYNDGVVELTGTADSAEAMEKAVLMAGNVQGVSEVKADGVSAPPQPAPVEYYVFRPLPSATMEMPRTIRAFSTPIGKSSRIPT